MRSLLALIAATALSACGALQHPEVAPIALASRSADTCSIDIEVSFPAVHAPASYVLGSQRTKNIFRFYVPEPRGAYVPDGVRMTRVDSSGKEDPNQWHLGNISFWENHVKIELFQRVYDTVKPWPFNGTYELSGVSACK